MPLAGLCVSCVNGVPFNACTTTNLQVPLAEDQHVVQALAAKCSREPSASFRAKSTSHPNTRTMNK
jgi:hypothetical protein